MDCGLSVCVAWTVLCWRYICLDGRRRMWPNLPRISKCLSVRTLLLPLLPVATWHKHGGKSRFATHLHLQLEMQRMETEHQGTGTGNAGRERCGLQHCKMGGWHRPFIFLFSSGPTVEKPTWYWTEQRRSATTAGPSCTAPTSRAAPTPWPMSTAAATRAGPLATGRVLCMKVGPPAWKSSFPSSATHTATPSSGETGVRRLATLSYFPWNSAPVIDVPDQRACGPQNSLDIGKAYFCASDFY